MKVGKKYRNVGRAVFEALESRQMLSTVTLADGVLTLAGDATRGTDLTVQLNTAGTQVIAQAGDVQKSYALNQVKRITAFGGAGDDTIIIDQKITLPTWISAGEGNNTVLGGGGDNTIFAGRGTDHIDGRGQHNLIMDLDAQGNPVVNPVTIDAPYIGPVQNPTTTTGRDLPQIKNLKITWQGRQVTVSADAQPNMDYLVQVQGDVDAPVVFVCQGTLPVTFSLPIADRIFGVLVTPFQNGIAGAQQSQVLDVGSVGVAQPPNPVFGGQQTPAPTTPTTPAPTTPANTDTPAVPTTPTTPTTPTVPTMPTVPVTPSVPTAPVSPVSSQLQAKIDMIGGEGYAGSAVQVQATNSSLGKYDPLDVRYQWDFGDAGSKYNQMDGYNAAHAYDNPGTYTVTLTLTDPTGAVSVARAKVNILADSRRTIYVASDGSDANNGLSPNAPVKSIGRVQQLLGDNTRVLFKSGQTFVMDQTLNVSYENVYVGAYGSGARPQMIWNAGNLGGSIALSGHNDVINGLSFNVPSQANNTNENGPMAIIASGVDLMVRNCEFLHLGYAINGNGQPDGLLVMDNTAPLATGVTGYFVWCEGSDYTIIGNTAANSTREHIVRMEFTQRMNVSYNNFTNLDRTKLGDANDRSKGTVIIHNNTYAWVAHNTLTDGQIQFGPLEIPGEATAATRAERTTWTVVEGNDVENAVIEAHTGATGIVIRNNIIHPPTGNYGLMVVGYNSEYQRSVQDVRILNNTVISDDQWGGLLNVTGSVKGITLDNNLFVDPNYQTGAYQSALVYVTGSDLSSFTQVKGNVYQVPKPLTYANGGYFYVWSNWADARGYLTPQEWDAYSQVSGEQFASITLDARYAPQSNAASVSSVSGVFTDFYGNIRPLSGNVTAGAVQA